MSHDVNSLSGNGESPPVPHQGRVVSIQRAVIEQPDGSR